MEVEDIAVFEVLNNPTRFRILRRLVEPKSARDIAEELDVPPTRLYYHFNMLEEAGVIEVVETRKVGAMLQKLYQNTARSFRPSPKLSQGHHDPGELARIAVSVVLDGARVDAEESVSAHFERLRTGDSHDSLVGSLGRTVAFMDRERAEAFRDKLEKLIEEEFDANESTEGIEFGLSYVFFPLAGSAESA
jgi:DNA-binding transcriptional ArsR family regulator